MLSRYISPFQFQPLVALTVEWLNDPRQFFGIAGSLAGGALRDRLALACLCNAATVCWHPKRCGPLVPDQVGLLFSVGVLLFPGLAHCSRSRVCCSRSVGFCAQVRLGLFPVKAAVPVWCRQSRFPHAPWVRSIPSPNSHWILMGLQGCRRRGAQVGTNCPLLLRGWQGPSFPGDP